jgi:hypothetical protein
MLMKQPWLVPASGLAGALLPDNRQVADRARVSPTESAGMGMSRSPKEVHMFVSRITTDRSTFTGPVSTTTAGMIDQQAATPAGDPVGPRIAGAAARTRAALDSNAWRPAVPLLVIPVFYKNSRSPLLSTARDDRPGAFSSPAIGTVNPALQQSVRTADDVLNNAEGNA